MRVFGRPLMRRHIVARGYHRTIFTSLLIRDSRPPFFYQWHITLQSIENGKRMAGSQKSYAKARHIFLSASKHTRRSRQHLGLFFLGIPPQHKSFNNPASDCQIGHYVSIFVSATHQDECLTYLYLR